jgi:hypothetical protein
MAKSLIGSTGEGNVQLDAHVQAEAVLEDRHVGDVRMLA